MVIRMRHTRSHTANRRSHHSLKGSNLSACQSCGKMHLAHRVCANCGKYNGKQIINAEAQIARKERRTKEKNKALGIEPKAK